MITPHDVAGSTSRMQDINLQVIESLMDQRIAEAKLADLPHAFVIIEDYPASTQGRVEAELVPKYRAAGWNAMVKGHFMVYFDKSAFPVKPSLLEVTVCDGKYTVIQDANGRLHALRYGKPWRDLVGDGLILALASEVDELRNKVRECEGDGGCRAFKLLPKS